MYIILFCNKEIDVILKSALDKKQALNIIEQRKKNYMYQRKKINLQEFYEENMAKYKDQTISI